MKKITVMFGPEGQIQIEAHGYKGKSCEDATKFLAEALGTEKDTKHKIEWFMRNAEANQKAAKFGVNASMLCG